jgi:serine/threonine-protein kinase
LYGEKELFSREPPASAATAVFFGGIRRSKPTMKRKSDLAGYIRRGVIPVLAMVLMSWLTSQARADQPPSEPTGGARVSSPLRAGLGIFAQTSSARAKQSWWTRMNRTRRTVLIGGGIVLAIGVIVLLYYLMGNKGKRSRLQVTENQIGPYRMQNLLATGHMSQVWEVVEVISNRHFAMKLLLPENVHSPLHRRLLFHEAEVGKLLAHQNVIRITTVEKDPDHPFFIMEFFPSGSLKMRIMRKEFDFLREKAHDIFKQTMTGLAYMNASGWVHRDVKPENILVNSAGEVRIIDFAIAQKISKRRKFRRRGTTQGTRTYMSPEQIRGQGLDSRSDIYSFGVMAYEVVTGRPPFRGGTPEDLLNKHLFEKPMSPQIYNPEVTKEFAELILRMLAKKPEERPRDFHELLMQFRNIRVFKGQAVKKEEKV